MLYPTLNQPIIILMTFLAGIASGIIFDGVRILALASKGDALTKHVLEFAAAVASCLLLFATNLKFNFGQFRIYVIAIFLISFLFERIFSSFLWTKLIKKWYSSIAKRSQTFGKRKKGKIN
ncbi:MAG: spore cortex biosynthesis protein YabQ [Clostridia bacterium]|nr:spore cortex biosynthesis protein YabQ [Clostridia bacterium]